MQKIAILSEYDGTCFHGWQQQQNACSVQGTLIAAWQKLCGEDIHLIGSSRTDTGVHAFAHVSAFTSKTTIPLAKIPLAWNSFLPAGLVVKKAIAVPEDFHACFQAVGKCYRYQYYEDAIRPALQRNFYAHIPPKLDFAAMQESVDYFQGTHDFKAFMDQGTEVKTTVRQISEIQLKRNHQKISLWLKGNGFLYHMVRIIAGTILAVGQHKIKATAIPEILAQKERHLAGKTMPPQGLCLLKVYYPKSLFGEDSWDNYQEKGEIGWL